MANDITLKVGVDSSDAKEGFDEVVKQASQAASEAQSQFSDVFKGAFAGGALANIGGQITGVLQEGVTAAVQAGANFETALQSVSAITGQSGQDLENLGVRAQDLALKFGGSATTQVEAFGTVLSKFGADLAKTPEALGTVAESVNILGKAAGLDAKASVDALSASMLQFGVDASDPAKLASESGRFINVLAASAKVGAAEIPQVSEAILQAGVAAKGAGLSFEETNAAIQGLAVGGKVGSEAGVALRNVIGKLIDGGGEQKKVLESVGLSYEKLGKTLTTSAEDGGGLASALEMLKGGLDKIQDPAAKAAAAGKLFGAENASAAGILLDQVDNIKLFTEGVTGTNEATVQAAINQDTLAQRLDKVKAAIEVGLIQAFQALTPIVKFVFDNLGSIALYLSPIALGLLAVGANALIASGGLSAMSIATAITSSAVWKFTASLLANPIFLIAAGIAAATIGVVALADAMSTSTEENIENAESQQKVIEEQIKLNKEQQDGERQTKLLVNEFQQLASKSELSAKEQKRLQEIQSKLEEKYPKLIDATKSYKDNLKGVDEVGKTSTATLGKLRDQSAELEKEFQRASREIVRGQRELALGELYSSTTTFLNGATALTDKVQEFKDAIYSAKNVDQINAAQLSIIRTANQLGEKGFGSLEKQNKFVAGVRDAAQKAISYLDFYKKKVEEPVEIKTKETKDTTDTDKKDKDKKDKQKKSDDARIKSIQELLDIEKAYQETRLEAEQKIADATTGGELTAEQKKRLYDDELARLKLILEARGEEIVYDGIRYKSIQEIGKISVDENGKITSSLVAAKDQQEKVRASAVKFYDDIQDQINKLNTNLAKLNSISTAEGFKREFERIKKASDDLQKSLPEKLDIKFAFKVGTEEYKKQIDELQQSFVTTNEDINSILSNADEKQKSELLKNLEENKKAEERITREYNGILERVQIEGESDANKRRLNLSLLDLRLKYEKEREENAGNFTKLAELEEAYLQERVKLQEEYDRQNNIEFGIQSAVMGSLMNQFNISRLIEEREANRQLREEKKKALDDEESDLDKSLADRTISFEEYQQKLGDIQQQRIDAGLEQEKLGEKLLADLKVAGDQALSKILTDQGNKINIQAQDRRQKQIALDAKVSDQETALRKMKGQETTQAYIDAQKALEKAQKDAADNDKDVYGFRESVIEEFVGNAAIQFAQLAASGKANLADFGKVTVQLAFEALQKMIPIWVASIFGEEVSKMGIAGIATSAALTAALYGLFAAANSAAGFKDGVVELQGEGTETSDSIPAWLSKGESVITAKATKQNKDELKWMNETGLPLREFYRNQLSQTSVDSNGDLIHEIRQLRKTTADLGMQITRRTDVTVHGVLQADGQSITAMIEQNRKRNSRRI